MMFRHATCNRPRPNTSPVGNRSMAAANDTPPERSSDPLGDPLLGRVHSVAQAISDRIRAVLGHHAPVEHEHDPDQPLRVLVVDDNADAADALAAIAELLGCTVRVCYGGVEALDALGGWEARAATALAGFHFHLLKPIDMPTLRVALDQLRAARRASTPRPSDDTARGEEPA